MWLLQAVAQGRVWSGQRAVSIGLVDAVGGIRKAIALAKEAAGIAQDEGVRLLELSRAKVRPSTHHTHKNVGRYNAYYSLSLPFQQAQAVVSASVAPHAYWRT